LSAEPAPRQAGSGPAAVPRFTHGSRVPGWDRAADLERDPAAVPDPATTEVPADLRREIAEHMAKYPDRRSAVLPALAAAQRVHGWCSPQALEQVACVMALTPAYLDAVATFYDMLETEPVGRHSVYVCTNISCSMCGADELLQEVRAAAAGEQDINVRAFECMGACDIAPMASVDGVYVGPLEPADAGRLVKDILAGRPVLEAKQLARRPCADPGVRAEQSAAGASGQGHRARAGAANPDVSSSAGPPMKGDAPGPAAPIERPPAADGQNGGQGG